LLGLLPALGFPRQQQPCDFSGVQVIDTTRDKQAAKLNFAVGVSPAPVILQAPLFEPARVPQAS
jgi:hypothetical protein